MQRQCNEIKSYPSNISCYTWYWLSITVASDTGKYYSGKRYWYSSIAKYYTGSGIVVLTVGTGKQNSGTSTGITVVMATITVGRVIQWY